MRQGIFKRVLKSVEGKGSNEKEHIYRLPTR